MAESDVVKISIKKILLRKVKHREGLPAVVNKWLVIEA